MVETPGSTSPVYRVGDAEVDVRLNLVRRGGGDVPGGVGVGVGVFASARARNWTAGKIIHWLAFSNARKLTSRYANFVDDAASVVRLQRTTLAASSTKFGAAEFGKLFFERY